MNPLSHLDSSTPTSPSPKRVYQPNELSTGKSKLFDRKSLSPKRGKQKQNMMSEDLSGLGIENQIENLGSNLTSKYKLDKQERKLPRAF